MKKRYNIVNTPYWQEVKQSRRDFLWFCFELFAMAVSLPLMVYVVQFL